MGEGFIKVADTKEIPPSKMKEVQVDGENVCIANVDKNATPSVIIGCMKEAL